MRRTWIKLYVDQCLRGSIIAELTAEQRWQFFGFLLLAGDSPNPGVIYKRKDADGIPVGHSALALADMLDIDPGVYDDGVRRMIEKSKITIDDRGVITIVNWHKYQSEYQRQKPYRAGYKVACNKSYDIEGDVEGDVEGEKKRAVGAYKRQETRASRIGDNNDPRYRKAKS